MMSVAEVMFPCNNAALGLTWLAYADFVPVWLGYEIRTIAASPEPWTFRSID